MYTLAPNQVVAKFPYSLDDLRQENPNVSFPTILTPEVLAEFDVFIVVSTSAEFDGATQVAELNGCIFKTERSRWETAWTVRDKTAEEVAEYLQQLQDAVTADTQTHLDNFARTRGYDSILSACTYATSPTSKFAAEGQYCVQQRDATWGKLYVIMSEVQSELRPVPSGFDDIVAELPELVWPI